MTDPVKTKFKYDHSEDEVVLQNVQDVEPLLELNKKELTGDSMYGTGDNAVGMRKVALSLIHI